jgi:hypothetical protein
MQCNSQLTGRPNSESNRHPLPAPDVNAVRNERVHPHAARSIRHYTLGKALYDP